MERKIFLSILLGLVLSLLLPAEAPAAVAGRLTQVEGRVEFLKQGKLPVTPAKLNDEVEPGDVLRTKSLSKAQITFVDGSVLTISPGSRIAVEEYSVDKGKRNAVLQLFNGIALAVVSKIFQSAEPDFMVKTHTAVMGVRGTEVGILLHPNSSTFLNFSGRTRVSNLWPEIQGTVELADNQGTTVEGRLPPTLPFEVSAADREQFMRQLASGSISRLRREDADSLASESGLASLEDLSDFNSVTIFPLLRSAALPPPANASESSTAGPPPSPTPVPIPPPPPPGPSSGPPYGPPSPPLAGPPGQSFQPPGPPLGPPGGGPPYGNAFGRSR